MRGKGGRTESDDEMVMRRDEKRGEGIESGNLRDDLMLRSLYVAHLA